MDVDVDVDVDVVVVVVVDGDVDVDVDVGVGVDVVGDVVGADANDTAIRCTTDPRGAVSGGDLYGRFPTLAMGGPDDATGRGVWVPTTSVDQYAATFASWLGMDQAGLAGIFPNLANFPQQKLAFLG